jgi:hypothetical protein
MTYVKCLMLNVADIPINKANGTDYVEFQMRNIKKNISISF